MNVYCATFEETHKLEPVEVRTLDISKTFPDSAGERNRPLENPQYPITADVGLFKVAGKK